MEEIYHIPAMLKETIDGLAIKPNGVYVDVTFGGGGHSRAILNHLTPTLSQGEGVVFTRDILYVCAQVDKKDTLHLFVCHLPSQRGGAAESEWKRTAVKEILQRSIDSVYALHPAAKIIVMGDMNSEPKEDLDGLRNLMKGLSDQVPSTTGTHKYHGRWSCLDQFYTSPALDSLSTVRIYDAEWVQEPDEKYLGLRPKRTFHGYRYQKDGFSDHLPIVLMIK